MTKRNVVYITGTRADYGLMRATLRRIAERPELHLSLIVTGTHLHPSFGSTIEEIRRDGFEIAAEIPVPLEDSPAAMARGIAVMVEGFSVALERLSPDIVLLLGDRGEMLAGVIAAGHLNIVTAHIHGGERSGTIDESVRHAISKLAHLHFVATAQSAWRLKRMGEDDWRITVAGAPGLVGLIESPDVGRSELAGAERLNVALPIALLVYHPVHGEQDRGGQDVAKVIDVLRANDVQIVALMPNSDSGSPAIRYELEERAERDPMFSLHVHLERRRFVAWMAAANVMVGNSSAGIIEAASFGTPVINIGCRQHFRERNANVHDVEVESDAFETCLRTVLKRGRLPSANVYGDGKTDVRIAHLLATVELGSEVLAKYNAY